MFILKQSKAIKGVNIGDVKHILSQFADDATIRLDGPEKSRASAVENLDLFSRLSIL